MELTSLFVFLLLMLIYFCGWMASTNRQLAKEINDLDVFVDEFWNHFSEFLVEWEAQKKSTHRVEYVPSESIPALVKHLKDANADSDEIERFSDLLKTAESRDFKIDPAGLYGGDEL